MEGPNFYELGASSSRLLAAAAAKAEMAIFVHTHTLFSPKASTILYVGILRYDYIRLEKLATKQKSPS